MTFKAKIKFTFVVIGFCYCCCCCCCLKKKTLSFLRSSLTCFLEYNLRNSGAVCFYFLESFIRRKQVSMRASKKLQCIALHCSSFAASIWILFCLVCCACSLHSYLPVFCLIKGSVKSLPIKNNYCSLWYFLMMLAHSTLFKASLCCFLLQKLSMIFRCIVQIIESTNYGYDMRKNS